MPCHKVEIVSCWFLKHDNEFGVLKWPGQMSAHKRSFGPLPEQEESRTQEFVLMDVQTKMIPSCQNGAKALRTLFQSHKE